MSRRPPPARTRSPGLSSRFAIVVSCGLLLVSFALGVYANRTARTQELRQANVQAQILANSLAAPLAFEDQGAIASYLQALHANPAVEAVAAYGVDGRLAAGFRRGAAQPPSVNKVTPPRIADGQLVVTAPVVQGSTQLGSVYLRTATDPLVRRLARYSGIGIIVVMASLLIGVLGAANASLREAHRKLQAEIAEREKAEEALRQAQKMEAMGQLTGGVAHDFNNLLMVASSGLELIDRTSDPDRRERLKQGIRQAIDRGANLTQQLLAFSRKTPMKSEVVDLRALLEEMNQVLERSLREDITVSVRADGEIWPVEVDASQFEVAVLNIAINARDAMPTGGAITIRLANEGHRVRVAVSDTGVGIPSEAIPRLFEPFYTTKPVGQGTGLGLSQVYGFARASGGEVRVDSTVGQGTTVTLLLPRAEKTLTRPPPPSAAPRSKDALRKGRVLVVEDDSHVAELVGDMLQELGYEPRHVANASDALDLIRASADLDLVLTDMVMPGLIGGLDLARRIMAERPDLPVVLTTGYSASASEAAADGLRLLLKPYRIEALAAELQAALKARPQRVAPQ